jgi:hypothetical protein
MGGRPLLALNLTAWPGQTLPLSVLADQTSGGLLLATSSPDALVAELGRRGAAIAAVIGRVTSGQAGHIEVRP